MNTLGPKMAVGTLAVIFLVFVTWNTTTPFVFSLPVTVVFLWVLVVLAFIVPIIFTLLMRDFTDENKPSRK